MTVPVGILMVCPMLFALPAPGFSPERTEFSVKVNKEIVSYRLMSVFVLPEETVTIEVMNEKPGRKYRLETSAGRTVQDGSKKWKWQAPSSIGLYPLKIIRDSMDDSMTLNVFVMVPYSCIEGEYINGYRMGRYPDVELKKLPIYLPPKGFVEVTEGNREAAVSPHFRLDQFLCKQESDYPKYLVLRTRLLLKLETILEKVNEQGYACETLHVMSGYRTPYYNKVIGNVKYSRHLWGGAADIFIDKDPEDGMMDDLNQDGRVDYQDAAILYDIIDGMYGKSWYEIFKGGLGRYRKTRNHGPFVHVDVRGFRARWGD